MCSLIIRRLVCRDLAGAYLLRLAVGGIDEGRLQVDELVFLAALGIEQFHVRLQIGAMDLACDEKEKGRAEERNDGSVHEEVCSLPDRVAREEYGKRRPGGISFPHGEGGSEVGFGRLRLAFVKPQEGRL